MELTPAIERILRERQEQGFGPKVEDPAILAKVAGLLAEPDEVAA